MSFPTETTLMHFAPEMAVWSIDAAVAEPTLHPPVFIYVHHAVNHMLQVLIGASKNTKNRHRHYEIHGC
jgi:hypothetical protein